jgi:CheY-like chemotaxis protein/anti-sigma regulatory factor (Ser/Thr protein kinase)
LVLTHVPSHHTIGGCREIINEINAYFGQKSFAVRADMRHMSPASAIEPDAPVAGRVLVVDDDPVSRRLLAHVLQRTGYTVTAAAGGLQARHVLEHACPCEIDCVLTDYQMPELDGIDLLKWIEGHPGGPAVVMVTGQGEKETVAASLRHGAVDYLEKPVDTRKLVEAVRRAVHHTAYRREVSGLESAAVRIAKAQHSALQANLGPNVSVYHRPRHALGGDSISRFDIAGGRRLYLVSDVSGHDLDSAFASAYFQGVVRGMAERGASVPDILQLFNRLLLDEWSGTRGECSISLCGIETKEGQASVTVFRCGSPLVIYADGFGQARSVAFGRTNPLGWFESATPAIETLTGLEGGTLHAWTDGLEDLAEDSGVSPLSLAWRLLQGAEQESISARAADDVLAARIDLECPHTAVCGTFTPLLVNIYSPAQIASIDSVQQYWQRSLRMALPEIGESVLYDVLLCAREAVLNALEHGCRPDDLARFVLSWSPRLRTLRAHVADPGLGHGRDLATAECDADSEMRGRGLLLIRHMTDACVVNRRGAELTMDWRLEPKGERL